MVLLASLLTMQGLRAETLVYTFTDVKTDQQGAGTGFVADNGDWDFTKSVTVSTTGGVNFTLGANGNFVMQTADEGFYDIKKVTINAMVKSDATFTPSVTFGIGETSGILTSTSSTDIVLEPTNCSLAGGKLAIAVIGQATVYLNSITVEWTTPGSISYDVATVEKTFGDANFTNALNKTGDGSVSYATGNDKIATVDAATGEVTIVGAGETTITATVADGTDYTYATKTASYTLKVAEATMTVTSADYSGVYDGQAHGITVTAPSGATVKYGTTAGTYDLDTNPTYTDVGTYTVYYQVTQTNYITVTGSKTVTITPAAGSISYATATVEKTFGDSKFTNALTKTGDGSVSYATGNDKIATVDAAQLYRLLPGDSGQLYRRHG